MNRFSRFVLLSFALLAAAGPGSAASLKELFDERLKSVVAVEFFVQDEIERHPVVAQGTVADAQGTIILPAAAIAPGVPPEQLKDFRVYLANSTEPFKAEYLGQDALTGWHFVRVEERMRASLVPVTQYERLPGELSLGDELWGIGLRNKDEDFAPYFLSGRIALISKLPQKTAILATEVASPGLPTFDLAGRLAGLTQSSFGQNFLLFSQNQNATPILLVNVEESSVVWANEEFLPNLVRIPQTVTGRPIAWFGAYGVQPLDAEVGKLMKLEAQRGVVLSDLLDNSPATKAGLKERDIVIALDGRPLPRLKPDRMVVGYFGQEILRRRPGDTLNVTVIRDGAKQDIKVVLGDEPKLVREAERKYFERLGFTAREFLVTDGLINRVKPEEGQGLVVQFVKPGGAAATAGLRPDDWVREIDGVEIHAYADATAKLEAIEKEKGRSEFVLLVGRGGDTSVLRVKLN